MISHDTEEGVPPRATPPLPLVFHGLSPCGLLGLTLAREPGASGPVSGVEQVLRLAQAESLIRTVEHWLGGPWDPAPLPADAPAPGGDCRVVVRDPTLAPPGSALLLPRAALQATPPEALRAPALAWPAQPATVVLGEVPVEVLARLQVGGVLWLPASFAPTWEVVLVDAAAALPPAPARLDLDARRLTVAPVRPHAGAPQTAAATPTALQAVLSNPVQLPLDHWLGWPRDGAQFHWPLPQPWLAELRHGSAVRARGALLPLGTGCGLRIETLAPPPATD